MKTLIKRTFKYMLVILVTCLIFTSIGYFITNDEGDTFGKIAINTSFIVIMLFFCYALLQFVTQRGLFNGIRYSSKHVKATLSKSQKVLMMDEHGVDNDQDLKEVMKEKYLYERPHFASTYPLLISSTILFITISIISFAVI